MLDRLTVLTIFINSIYYTEKVSHFLKA